MKEIFKTNSLQVYNMWRNTAYGLLVIALMLLVTFVLPTFFAPLVSGAAAFSIYLLTYNDKNRRNSCLMHSSVILISLLSYTAFLIIINIASLWITEFDLWFELSFFTAPYVPILILAPSVAVTSGILILRGENANVCTECKLNNGHYLQCGQTGLIMHNEIKKELRNLFLLFSVLTVTSWLYFFLGYNNVNVTSRDAFVFNWLPLILIIIDIFYFGMHYYDIYLDLQQHDLVISPKELREMSVKTWVRYYVICEDSMYLNMHAKDEINELDDKPVVETPFIVSHESDGISENDALSIIRSLTGVRDGRLRFFFERKSADNFKHYIVRFFYFLPGDTEMYPHLRNVAGVWINSDKFKNLHHTNPNLRLSALLGTDMNRLATILITSKTFNEKGERRTKLKQYHPSFSFEEIEHSKLDFQDNTWMRISTFNSNTSFFKLKRFWRNLTHSNKIPVD